MQEIKIKVNAKINLSLDIKGVREDGYHLLDMLMSSVSIYDIIYAKKSSQNIILMDGKEADKNNTALKALELLKKHFGITMHVEIQKGIPFSSGMGGSSADASGVFYCAYRLYGVEMEKLLPLALKVGCDVPYMIYGGDARVTGVGEEIAPLTFPNMHLVIAQKVVGASTGEIYKNYDKCGGEKGSIDKVLDNINVSFLPFNVLEKSAVQLCPEIEKAKKALMRYTDKVFMTGSGSAYVGVFLNEESARKCLEGLDDMIYKAYAATKDKGIEEITI